MKFYTQLFTFPRRILLTAVVLSFCICKSYGQNPNPDISLSSRNIPLGELITQIESQSPYRFAFMVGLIDTFAIIKITETTLPVIDVLDTIAETTGLKYVVSGKYITFVRREPEPQPSITYRTSDRYRPTNISDLSADPRLRPLITERAAEQAPQPDTVSEIQTPVYYSAYVNPNPYSRIQTALPKWAVKSNLLYAGATLTPNLSLEIGTGPRTSIEITGSYNPWNWEGNWEDNKKIVHYMLRVEYRWWMCERFNGHYIGPHVFYNNYNVGQITVPTLFKKDYQYEGWALGAGLSYGYNLTLASRWGLEFTAGLGMVYLKQNKYDCGKCGEPIEHNSKWYFGPTRIGINLVFMFN